MLADAAGNLDAVAILSRVLHTTCGATMLGGLIYLRFVLLPAATGGDKDSVLFAGRRSAWAACVGVCTALLLVSGGYNFYLILTQYEKPASPYHAVIGLKMLLAFVVFALMALTAGKTGLALRMRENLSLWFNVALGCALAIFLLGAIAKSVPHTPKHRGTVGLTAQDRSVPGTTRATETEHESHHLPLDSSQNQHG